MGKFSRQIPGLRQAIKISETLEDVSRKLDSDATRSHLAELLETNFRAQPRFQEPKRVVGQWVQAYSQNFEDGIIAEIFARIGTTDRFFVEIGAGDGLENNSALLLTLGWRGLWIECDPENLSKIRRGYPRRIASGQLVVDDGFVTRENIAGTLTRCAVPAELDLLSVDVDRNTWYIWEALGEWRPRVAVIEYNAQIPPSIDWKIDYQADAVWDGTLHFGASLKALENLGRECGYSLVGCDPFGVNAFFVREDLTGDAFKAPFTAEEHFEPLRLGLVRHRGHPRDYVDMTAEAQAQGTENAGLESVARDQPDRAATVPANNP